MQSPTATFARPQTHRRYPKLSSNQPDRLLRAGEYLVHAGDRVAHPWLVVAGILKSYALHEDGTEQVIEFHMPGDIIGLDALVDRGAGSSAVALDTSNVRPLAIEPPSAREAAEPRDADLVLIGMYREIQRLTRRLQLASSSTDQRLASYLDEFSAIQARQGCKPWQFRLPMGRRDLAGYLGLATETLSRTFTRLRDGGLIEVDNHDVTILDPEGLRRVARQPRHVGLEKAGGAAGDECPHRAVS